jgi:hypothetical protein
MISIMGTRANKDAKVSEQLRAALLGCGETRYVVSKATGITESSLSKFVHGQGLSQDAIDVLAAYLGLRLVAEEKGKGK